MLKSTIVSNVRNVILSICTLFSGILHANTITVDSLNDSGFGSLRQAVMDANSGDTITFSSLLDGDTIKLTGVSHITINKNLTIIGNNATNTIIDGMANSRIFQIDFDDKVLIDGVILQNGSATGSFLEDRGGAILNHGSLTFTNSVISGNFADGKGGAISHSSDGSITMTNSTISGNSASFAGGGIHFDAGIAIITNSTISGNSSDDIGGGIYNEEATTTVTNCTISGNSTSDSGGGIYINTDGTIALTNSIVAKNTDDGSGPDIFHDSGMVIDSSNNLIGDTTSVGSFFNLSTLLGSTASPLDPLFVMDVDTSSLPNSTGDLRLQCTSPAVNAGDPDTSGLSLGTVDIDGNPRVAAGIVDVGAYENFNPLCYALGPVKIIGPSQICAGTMPESYTCEVEGATGYEWSYAGGIIGPADTLDVQIASAIAGDLIVKAFNMVDTVSDTLTITIISPTICALANCATTTVYVSQDILDDNILPDEIRAQQNEISDGVIAAGKVIRFFAGDQIILDTGFGVEQGAVFEANIEGCAAAAAVEALLKNADSNEKRTLLRQIKALRMRTLNGERMVDEQTQGHN